MALGDNCSSSCKTKNHNTFGDCIRSKTVSVHNGESRASAKRWDGELDGYRTARAQGIEPDGTTKEKVEYATILSNETGAAYGRDFNVATPKGDM
jgi:hypothetical protein